MNTLFLIQPAAGNDVAAIAHAYSACTLRQMPTVDEGQPMLVLEVGEDDTDHVRQELIDDEAVEAFSEFREV